MYDDNIELSVIVPVYNAEKYISRCIKSILSNQGIGLELIMINDGSSDRTEEIIKEYLVDDRLIYIKKKNEGVSVARNIGIMCARGTYIIFVDADDYIPDNSLKDRIKKTKNADLLISNFNIESHREKDKVNSKIIEKKEISQNEALWALSVKSKIGYQGYLWNKVFRRSLILDNNIFFKKDIYYGEDRLFIAEYILSCGKIELSNDYVYNYCINDTSTMSAMDNINERNYSKIYSEIIGLHELEIIVKTKDMELYQVFIYYEYLMLIRFIKNTDRYLREFKKTCKEQAKCKLKEILTSNYKSNTKLKAIAHYLLMY